MKQAIIRQGWSNWLVVVGTISKYTGDFIKPKVLDIFSTKTQADKRVDLFNYVMKKCQEYCEKRKQLSNV